MRALVDHLAAGDPIERFLDGFPSVSREQAVRFIELAGQAALMSVAHPVYELLDTVVLACDVPEHALRRGDVGAVVEIHGSETLEIEFVTGSGRAQALVTLAVTDVRPVEDRDLIAVRPLDESR